MKKKIITWVALIGLMYSQALAQPCDTVRLFPWANNFLTAFGCWEQLGDSSSMWQPNLDNNYNFTQAAYISAPSDSVANGCVLVSPALALPADSSNMLLSFKTRLIGTSVQFRVLVSTGMREDLSGYDTLLSVTPGGINNYEVNLSAYSGQTVHIAFSLVKPNQSYNLTFFGIGNINIISDHMPQGEWLIQNMSARTADTVEHEYYLTQGIEEDSNTVFTWHSTMVEAGQATLVEVVTDMLLQFGYSTELTLPRSIYRVVYHTAGTDTVTVTASNIYGTITSQSVSNIYDCAPVSSFPWTMDFGDLGVCWSTDYSINNYATYGFTDEDDVIYSTDCFLQSPSYEGNFVLTNAIAVPADASHLALTLRWRMGAIEVRAARVGQGDDMLEYIRNTALFTDLLFNEAGNTLLKTRKINLADYAGDTIRLAIFNRNSNNLYLMPLSIDYDLLPKIASVEVPALVTTDSAVLCTATLRYGATEGLHYNWSSTRGGVFVTNTLGDSAWVTYPGGMGENDTIRVVVSNHYGSDTMLRTVSILDCSPQLVLPWKETFANGTACWYKTDGCKFHDAIPYNYAAYEHQRHLYLNAMLDTLGSWIMSKAITIPADVHAGATLFWKVASSNSGYRHLYSMLATTSADYTDTANYTVLYTDNSAHSNFSNYDTCRVSLAQYAGQTIHIAIHNHAGHLATSSIGLYLDDIEIHTTTLPVVALTSDASTYNWGDTAVFTATLLEGSNDGLTYTWHSTLLDSTATQATNTLTLSYFQSGIDTVTVVATNAYGSDTALVTVEIENCALRATPFHEDFESVAATAAEVAGNLPECWDHYWIGNNAAYAPHVVTTGGYADISNIPGNALLLVAGGSTGYGSDAVVFLPRIADSLQRLAMALDYRFENSSRGTLTVGWFDSHEAFHSVKTLTPHADSYVRDTIRFTNEIAADYRIALWWNYGSSWYAAMVDNIDVFADNSTQASDTVTVDSTAVPAACATLTEAEAVTMGPTSVLLSWQYDTLGTQNAQGVIIDLYDTTVHSTTTFVAHGTDTLLTGLPPYHVFRADLRTLCATDTAEALSISFSIEPTACAEAAGDNEYCYSYPISGDKNYGYSQTLYPAVLAASVDTLYGIALRISGASYESRMLDIYIGQTTLGDLTSPVSVATHTLAAHNYPFQPSSEWSKILFDNPVPLDGAGNLLITIDDNTGNWGNQLLCHSHQSTPGVMLYYNESFYSTVNVDPVALGFSVSRTDNIPDIQLFGNCATERCLQPVISLTPDTGSIHITWRQRGSENHWRVEYRLEGHSGWLLADTTSDTGYTLYGLNASSRYEVRVGSICDTDNIIYSDIAVVATPCGAIAVPYHQNFVADDIPCWTIHGDPNSLCSSQWGFHLGNPLVSPAITGDLTQMQVRITVKGSPYLNPIVKVGVGDATGYGNVTWIDSMMFSSETPTDFTVHLSGYTGNESHIVLSTAGQYFVRLQDFAIDYIDCQPVHHVRVSNLADTGAILTWPPVNSEGEWALYLDSELLAVVDTSYYILTDLVPGTDYTVAVREICSAGDTSVATTATFTTLCSAQPLPWSEDFESYPTSPAYTVGVEVPCWHTILPAINISSNISLVSIGSQGGSHVLSFYDHIYVTQHTPEVFIYAASSPISTGSISDADYQFSTSIERVAQSPNQPFSFQAGIMTDVTDTNTFIPLAVIETPCDTLITIPLTNLPALGAHISVAFRFRGDIIAHVDNLSIDALLPPPPPDTVWRSMSVTTNAPDACEIYGSGLFADNSTVKIGFRITDTANLDGHWQFLGWDDGGEGNPRNILITSDTAIAALFEWVSDSIGIDKPSVSVSHLLVYPNPAGNWITITGIEGTAETAIVDLKGRTVREAKKTNQDPETTLDLQGLPSGIYYVRIATKDGISVGRIIKK